MHGLGPLDILLFEGFRLDRRAGTLLRLDQAGVASPVLLGTRALDLLALLVEREGELVSKDEIMAAVWPGRVVEEANLNVQISKLRHILDRDRPQGSCIQTVTGRGYRFTAEVSKVDAKGMPEACQTSVDSGGGNTANSGDPCGPGAADKPDPMSLLRGSPVPHRFRRGLIASLIGGVGLIALMIGSIDWHLSLLRAENLKPPPLSIVVLPFANIGSGLEPQYFADGITEDLTADLSRVGELFVISHNTALTYRDKPIDTKQVGRELGVRYILEGDVQRSGDQIRISAQLSDAENAATLWSERFDGDTGRLFALQNEITRRIAVALKRELVVAEAARPTDHPDTLDYILRGRVALMTLPTRENRLEAISLFDRALQLEPRSVVAQSWLARTLATRVTDRLSDSAAADTTRAQELVGKALAASPSSPLAHYAKAAVLRAQDRFDEALPEYEMAIDTDRNWPGAYANLGQCKFYAGSLDESISLVQQAIRLSPRDPLIGIWFGRVGLAHLLQSRFDKAIYWLEKARSADPDLPYIHSRLAAALALTGETDRAAAELTEAHSRSGDDRYSNTGGFSAGYLGVPKLRALYEQVYFAGVRVAGMPEQ